MEDSVRFIVTNIFWAMLWVNDRPELFFILIIHFKAFNIDECLEDKFITKFIAEKHKCITCPSFIQLISTYLLSMTSKHCLAILPMPPLVAFMYIACINSALHMLGLAR